MTTASVETRYSSGRPDLWTPAGVVDQDNHTLHLPNRITVFHDPEEDGTVTVEQDIQTLNQTTPKGRCLPGRVCIFPFGDIKIRINHEAVPEASLTPLPSAAV